MRSGSAPSVAPSEPEGVRLARLGERARPVTLAGQQVLPVAPALAPLLPDGTLARGSSVAVSGPGATSLALGLVAAASAAGSWTAVVGAPDLGMVAAAEAGLALERTVLVAPPPPERWGTVVAALAETVELVLVRPPGRVRPADARRLAAHLRTRGGVLVRLPGSGAWPEPPDLALRATAPRWDGVVDIDRRDGAGRLRARRLVVEATGRRRAARPRRVALWLPGPDGAPVPVADPMPIDAPDIAVSGHPGRPAARLMGTGPGEAPPGRPGGPGGRPMAPTGRSETSSRRSGPDWAVAG